jgi:mono/diheme cytochrome c family protein
VAEAAPVAAKTYSLLSETGLYSNTRAGTLAPGVEPFEPRFALWSDGAVKRRWISLPANSKIDSSNMDAWKVPVGTKLWKEFSRDGVRVETRIVERTTASGWLLVAFQWKADQSDAVAVPGGVQNASGTPHDIPSATQCKSCHTGAPDEVLGFSAIQLAGATGPLDLSVLAARGTLSQPPATPLVVPGDPVAIEALGYLHANCGQCHNPASGVFFTLNLDLRLRSDSLATVQDTPAWKSAVGQPSLVGGSGGLAFRIAPGDPEHSAVVYRMGLRGLLSQMPPLATETVDATGLAAVRAWIDSLGPRTDGGPGPAASDAGDAADSDGRPITDASAGPG